MAIILNDNINLASNKPLDKRFGPYLSVNDALNDIPVFQRHQGLVVGIIENGSVQDYWFRDNINDGDLVSKSIDYTSITNAPTIPGDVSQLTDSSNLLKSFSFSIQSDDSGVFTVTDGTPLRLSGDFGVTVEEDSSEGLIISGPDLTNVNKDILPSLNETYNLGSPTRRWKDIFLSGASISLGNLTLRTTDDGGGLRIEGADSLSIGASTIRASAGSIDLPSGSRLNGEPLLTRIDLIEVENSFRLTVSGDDSSSAQISSGGSLNIIGTGGTTTRADSSGNLVINTVESINDLADVNIDTNTLSVGKVLKFNGLSWVAANESGNPDTGGGSGSGDAATLNGFDGSHYLNYNNLTNKPEEYVLPPATTTSLGGVIVGTNVNVNAAGRIDVPTGAGINTVTDIPNLIDVDGLGDGDTLVYNAGANRWEINTVDLSDAEMDGGFY